MLPRIDSLRRMLSRVIDDKAEQGHLTEGLTQELAALPDSYDALLAFAQRLSELPLHPDWPYHEPNDLSQIWAACDSTRPVEPIGHLASGEMTARIETAFLSSVCGCILGKPLELGLTLSEIRQAAERVGEWPLDGYVSEQVLEALGRTPHPGNDTTRERIRFVGPDDDINYRVIAMLLLEEHGLDLSQQHVMRSWLLNLPPGWMFGPERIMAAKAVTHSLTHWVDLCDDDLRAWVTILNPGEELCGALIRVDPYAYACPGHPALAAELAWRDASWSHRRSGIYGAMFAAAAISTAFVVSDWHDVFEVALQFVPKESRFHKMAKQALEDVAGAPDWLSAYDAVHGKLSQYGACRIHQECGTMMNTLRFARDVGHGICLQVSQGNDTDSFGATVGSMLGAFHGPDALAHRWLAPFNDTIHTHVAGLQDTSLTSLARRMARLPERVGMA